LGYYAIALMVLNSFMLIPGASREVLEPRLMQDINSIGNQEIIEDYLLRPLTNAAFYMPIMIGAAYFILPSLIKWILPRYISGIVPMQILVCGGYFLAMSYLVRGFVIAKKWHISVLLPLVSVLIVNVVIIIVFVKVSGQITGAAIGAGISNFILFVSLLIFIIRKCDTNDTKNLRKGIIPIIFPFIGMCIGFFILNYCFSFISINAFIEGIIKFLIFLFSLLIIIFIVERKYSYLDGFNINQLLKKKNIEPIKKHDNDNKEELGIFYE
ncbi:MAG: hypothetical protein Q8Q33_00025, partial [Chlamydiota bacterium]|nr:hypothetical protein [Chlamydiota bacterium]